MFTLKCEGGKWYNPEGIKTVSTIKLEIPVIKTYEAFKEVTAKPGEMMNGFWAAVGFTGCVSAAYVYNQLIASMNSSILFNWMMLEPVSLATVLVAAAVVASVVWHWPRMKGWITIADLLRKKQTAEVIVDYGLEKIKNTKK